MTMIKHMFTQVYWMSLLFLLACNVCTMLLIYYTCLQKPNVKCLNELNIADVCTLLVQHFHK